MDQMNAYEDRQPAHAKQIRTYGEAAAFWCEVRDTFCAGQSLRLGEMTVTMSGLNPVGMMITPLPYRKF